MTRLSERAGHWLGLCRKPPAVQILYTGPAERTEYIHGGLPGGGGGGAGAVHRGIGAAIEGIWELNRNRQLLWFTLLAGLVMAGNAVGQALLGYISWNMQPTEVTWFILSSLIEFATLLCLIFLLTGLALSIVSKRDGRASFFEGLTGAKKYLNAIMAWSAVLAIAGMLIFSMYFYLPDWLPRNHPLITFMGNLVGSILNPIMEYPFNPSLTPHMFFNPSRDGGMLPVFWVYPSGIMQTLIFSEVNLLLFILTPFVVPLIVVEQTTLRKAVAGSFTMMKKNWVESAACALFLGIVMAGVFLTYLIVQVASGMISPGEGGVISPSVSWVVFAVVYDVALFGFAMIMATVGGIAAMGICMSAKERQESAESTEPQGAGA